MRLSRPFTALAAAAAVLLVPAGAIAQRQQPTPEQRIDRLERQVNEMQRRVYPKGKPADTAGFSDDPAATQSSVITLDQRLDALERQMADMLRQSEENGNRLRSMEQGIGQLKSDEDQRIQALEQRMTAAEAAPSAAAPADRRSRRLPSRRPRPSQRRPSPSPRLRRNRPRPPSHASPPERTPTQLSPLRPTRARMRTARVSTSGKRASYDEAISTLKSFVATYPKHKRVSYANNLIGRAQLDKGDAGAAATTLLSNYRTDPGGERAPDSLYYLGQALMKLGQPIQACKAYGELDAVYGAKVRPDLKKLETDAKAQANCA